MNLVPESARHLEMTRARQVRVDTRDLAEADSCDVLVNGNRQVAVNRMQWRPFHLF